MVPQPKKYPILSKLRKVTDLQENMRAGSIPNWADSIRRNAFWCISNGVAYKDQSKADYINDNVFRGLAEELLFDLERSFDVGYVLSDRAQHVYGEWDINNRR